MATAPKQGASSSPAATGVVSDKYDIIGSSRTLAFDNGFNTVCVRLGVVRTTANNFDTINEAINHAALRDGGVFPSSQTYPFFNDLPLSRIRGQRWGPKKVLISAVYQRHRFSFDPREPFDIADMRTITVPVDVYRIARDESEIDTITGLPTGPIIGGNGDPSTKEPAHGKQIFVSAIQFLVRFNLAYNPFFNGLDQLVNTTNTDTVTWGGRDFLANTIVFNGGAVRQTRLNTGTTFFCQLHFTIRRGGWVHQVAYLPDQGPPAWSIDNAAPMYREVWNASYFDF
jgi:hypothetical protein